ncbi:hypothetical protein [Kluyvera huaxiensis]|uniref:hypothetical protein n=1 Tax=Kluyvera sp. 142053 TaxID=3160979 RepID=UPI0032DE5D1E
MCRLKVKELVAKAHATVGDLPPAQRQVMTEVITRLDTVFAALTESIELRAAVVAENTHARERHIFIRALAVSILEHSGGRMDWRGAMEDATELLQTVDSVYAKTPATDAFLADVRAKGAEQAGEYLKQYAQGLHEDARLVLQDAGELCNGFAAQLRQGAKS